MKECSNNGNSGGYSHRKKSKRRAARKRTLRFFTICCCLTVIIVITCLLINFRQIDTVEQLPYPYDSEVIESETEQSNILNVDEETVDETSWCLILANRWNYIPDDYTVELTTLENGQRIDTRIYPALQKMFDNARNDNVYPIVASGYRTTEKQQSLMDEKISDYENEGYSADKAKEKAEAWVAIPGTSEHQLGLSVDINADGVHSTGNEVYEWLDKNAYKYGFIHRYPSDKTEITGVINEPWHYRYVGIEAAQEIKEQGVCLEEYLKQTN